MSAHMSVHMSIHMDFTHLACLALELDAVRSVESPRLVPQPCPARPALVPIRADARPRSGSRKEEVVPLALLDQLQSALWWWPTGAGPKHFLLT